MPQMGQSERHTVKTGKRRWINIDNAHPELATLANAAGETLDTDDQDTHDGYLLDPKLEHTGPTP
jgi:hypothetical protein